MLSRAILTVFVLFSLTLPVCCETIGGAKRLPDGPSGTVTGVVTYTTSGECYIESEDRASGIWVVGDTADISVGDEVNVLGLLSTVNGERLLTASEITPTSLRKPVGALAMPLSRIGGSVFGQQGCVSDGKSVQDMSQCGHPYMWHWVPATGLNNTGLLVTTWGKVASTYYSQSNGLRWFILDDGSGLVSDCGNQGVVVYSDADVKLGQFVSVTGISSVETAIDQPDYLIRTIRPRTSEDVQVQRDVVPEYPFSDEFDGNKVDYHWGVVSWLHAYYSYIDGWQSIGSLSVGSSELRIDIPVGGVSGSSPFSKQLVQCVEGDWDMEVKLRIMPTLGQNVFQCIGVALKDRPSSPVPLIIGMPEEMEANWLAAIIPQTSNNPDLITGRMQYVAADTQVGYPKMDLDTLAKTVWFKVRKRGDMIYGSASTDGVNYTQEYSKKCFNRCFVAICGFSYSYYSNILPGPFSGFCDYIRFTRVSE